MSRQWKTNQWKLCHKRLLNTVFKKYAFGYILIGASLAFFLLLSMFASTYISMKYRVEIEKMIQLNKLQNAINRVSENANMSYSFLTKEGIEKYSQLKNEVDRCLTDTKKQVDEKWNREMADMNSVSETYIERVDVLMNDMESYVVDSSSIEHSRLNEEYNSVQENYSYVVKSFQNVYSSMFEQLNTVEINLRNIQLVIDMILVLFIIMIASACALYLLAMMRDISKSIKTLQAGVKSMEDNVEEATPIILKSNDEFENLAEAYNSMLGIIQTQMKKIEEDADMRERLSEAEKKNLKIYSDLQKNHLDFLQSRINPHFLFNTLNMISAQTRIEQADKSAELIELTATYLRYNLDNIKKIVTLDREVGNLKDYLAIQRYRYGDRFKFELFIEEECMGQAIPCMILQPLVENSIKHGVGMMVKGGCVSVNAYRDGKRVILEVRDNGVGESPERIQEIQKNLLEKTYSSSHIGIRNIFQRLRLYYKDDVTLEMKNAEPGLIITISLPYERKG